MKITRQEIIDCFAEMFARKGECSTTEIASALKISQSTVMYHFRKVSTLEGAAFFETRGRLHSAYKRRVTGTWELDCEIEEMLK